MVECRFYRPAILKALFKLIKTLLALVLLGIAAVVAYGMWYTRTPLAMQQTPLEVEIPRGSSVRGAITALEKAGLDVQRRQFLLLVRAFGRERDLKAGNYLLAKAPTPIELLEKLTRGD